MNNNHNYSNIDPQLELNRLQQIQLQQQVQQQQFTYQQTVIPSLNQPLYNIPLNYTTPNNNINGYSPPLVLNNQGLNIQPTAVNPTINTLYNSNSSPIYYSPQPVYQQTISPHVVSPLLNTAITQPPILNNTNNITLSSTNTSSNITTTIDINEGQNKTIDHDNQEEDEEKDEEEEDDEEEDEEEVKEEVEEQEKLSDDYLSDVPSSEDDNESYFSKNKQEQNNQTTRKRGNNYQIKFLSDDEEEEEDLSSDYESPKKKGRKKGITNKKKGISKKKSSVSKVEREYEILAASTATTRQRRSTARLLNEVTESTGEEDELDDQASEKEDSESDYQSDSDDSDKPKRPTRRVASVKSEDVYNNNIFESDVDSDEEDYTSGSDTGKKKKRRSRKQINNNIQTNNTMTHLNLRKRNDNSNLMFSDEEEDENNQRDEDELYDEEQQQQQPKVPQSLVVEAPIDEDTIEKVLDHRLKSSLTNPINDNTIENTNNNSNNNNSVEPKISEVDLVNPLNYEFLVKWKGWAHIHNTWDSYETLISFKGNKKLINYCKTLIEMVHWRRDASREDIEQADIQRELNRKEYIEHVNVERIIATREVEQTIAAMQQEQPENIISKTPTTQYLVKWQSLHYCDVTWEFTEDISEKFQNKIDDFLIRTQTQLATKANSVSAKKRVEIGFRKLEAQPEYLSAGQLRDYQLEGLNWLAHSWFTNTNVILADEMGLGKTIQTISFLSYLTVEQQMPGPFLVVVPLSTIENWQREFAKWAPEINVVLYNGASASRSIIREYEFYTYTKAGKKKVNFNVLLTTYEFIVRDKSFLGPIKWDYLAVDEAHRLKNNESALHEVLKLYHTGNRLLVTGTPLQNSLKELWNLLNFLMPNKFHSLNEFQEQYSDLKENDQIAELHSILKPHLLRRIKKDVEKSLPPKTERILRVDFTPLQKKYYKWILAKNFSELNKGVKGEKTTLLNIVTELKKTCNHPYLFESAIQESDGSLDQMVKGSGKLILLDKLLIRLKETGHRVLIFSQMVRMLDILAEYLRYRNFQFQRLDGSMSNDKRNIAMDRFNAPDSHDFCFLLSTRAGGLGINLTTADTVIIFDSDWNPQNDLQAEARAHRIGQKNQVNIYRLVSKGSIEEDILERAKQKMVLDHLVIQSMEKSATASKNSSNTFNKDDLEKILKFGAADLFKEGDDESNQMPEMDIDEILSRAEPTQNLENSEQTAGQELLNSFRVANFSTASSKEDVSWDQIIPDSERKSVSTEEDQIAVLGPRRRGSTLKNMPSLSANEPLSINVKPKKDISFFNNKEFKILVRSLKKFGTHKRCKEILADANFPTNKPVRSTEDICKEVIDSCRKAVADNRDADKVYIVYHGMDINAVEMMQRVQDMEVLGDLCQPHFQDYQNFRVTFPIRPVSWVIKWGPKEDAMLLMGAYKYGVGNWEPIKDDNTLGLDFISTTNDEKENSNNNNNNNSTNNKIKGSTLLRRLEALIKSATDVYMAKKSMNQEEEKSPSHAKSLSSRKRVPKTKSNSNVTKKVEKRKLPKYSDEEDEIEDDDEDYKDQTKPSPKKKLKSNNNKTTRATTVATQSPIRTSSGRMSVPPEKLITNSASKAKPTQKSNLFSDDDNPSKRSRSSGSSSSSNNNNNNNNNSKKPASTSSSEVNRNLVRKCKTLLIPIQKSLEAFRSLSDLKISREEKLTKTKKYLLEIGNGIDDAVRADKSKDPKDVLTKQLWEESSKYTTSNGDDLKNLYDKMKQKENSSKR